MIDKDRYTMEKYTIGPDIAKDLIKDGDHYKYKDDNAKGLKIWLIIALLICLMCLL